MAQTRRKRRTKHKGNAAGIVEQRGRTSRPPSPEARKQQRKELVTTALFVVFVTLALGNPIGQSLALGGFLFLLYIPLGYYTDMFFYRRFQGRAGKPKGRG
jgi:hypothetical protein